MRPRHDPKLSGVLNPYEPHEVLHVTSVRSPRLLVADIPKSLDGRRQLGEPVELGGRERTSAILTIRVLLLSSCPSFFARLLPMIKYIIMGNEKHEIHTLSRARLSEHEGDGLTLRVICMLQKTCTLLDRSNGCAESHTSFYQE
jgi:hypothetical protein